MCSQCRTIMHANGQQLICSCGQVFQFVDGVLSLAKESNYALSFGEQWSQFSTTQLDSFNGSNLSENRFFAETGWTKSELKNAVVLDAGCGSGRFTEIAARYAKYVISVDLSAAVFAFSEKILANKNIMRIHGDIRYLPLDFSKITHVFSIGVLQHTPNPYQTLELLIHPLSAGTKFAITTYGKKWFTKFQAKYVLRPITKQIDRENLLKNLRVVLKFTYSPLLMISGIPVFGKIIKFVLPISIYPELRNQLTKDQLFEFMLLDTLDALTPMYDNPLRLRKCIKILQHFSKDLIKVSKTPMIIRGIRK